MSRTDPQYEVVVNGDVALSEEFEEHVYPAYRKLYMRYRRAQQAASQGAVPERPKQKFLDEVDAFLQTVDEYTGNDVDAVMEQYGAVSGSDVPDMVSMSAALTMAGEAVEPAIAALLSDKLEPVELAAYLEGEADIRSLET
ncbi:MAG: hypothetical protein SVW02_02595 [Candidatus Nanohaloarchaea archaeon]|nr:hypothetical protein [Candidatus Nanohaloarchaea archaeon]